jgi:hypothetical protein
MNWEVRVESRMRPRRFASSRRADITRGGYLGSVFVSEAKLWSPGAGRAASDQLRGYVFALESNIMSQTGSNSVTVLVDKSFEGFVAAYKCGSDRCVTWGSFFYEGIIFYLPLKKLRAQLGSGSQRPSELVTLSLAIDLDRLQTVEDIPEQIGNKKRWDDRPRSRGPWPCTCKPPSIVA